MNLNTVCRDEHRRERVRRISNGIDYIDTDAARLHLTVHFFKKVPQELEPEHFALASEEGGSAPRVVSVGPPQGQVSDPALVYELKLSAVAGMSFYVLSIAGVSGIDPLYSSVRFSFAATCPTGFDCAPTVPEPPAFATSPRIDYLAKDYASFRQLMLDRLAITMPGWKERHAPDLGIAIVELLAYVADHLSYYQDAVTTEAHLGTARRRISVRRHARLVDYTMHEGCNARAWLHLHISGADCLLDPSDIFFITSCAATGHAATATLAAADLERISDTEYSVFEPVDDGRGPLTAVAAHSEMRFYTWGSRICWLPMGATKATLSDAWVETKQGNPDAANRSPTDRMLNLSAGDILILEERRSPLTGSPADADRQHRHAVRLTSVDRMVDPLFGDDRGRPVVSITWSEADALPFDLCLAVLGPPPECRYLGPDPEAADAAAAVDMAVALGNVMLVDHGRTVAEADAPWPGMIGEFATNSTLNVASSDPVLACEGESEVVAAQPPTVTFDPILTRGPLTFSMPWLRRARSAADLLKPTGRTPTGARPHARLEEERAGFGITLWSPCADLLDSDPSERNFVVEIDDEGMTHLRLNAPPKPGSSFRAQYRIGNGGAGNVGADAIRHVVSRRGALVSGVTVRNPLAATGGVDPESMAEVKVRAPQAFRQTIERAITADDYARLAERHGDVQRAAARIGWNGARASVVVAIDPLGATQAPPELVSDVKRFLFKYRRIGHDLRVVPAAYVPLMLELRVCVKDGYVRGHLVRDLRDVFSNRRLADDRLGLFHPDRLTFGESVYPSRILAAAHGLAGVDSVAIRVLTRLGEEPPEPREAADDPQGAVDSLTASVLQAGALQIGPFEIARLDNAPNAPERGILKLRLWGGR